MQVRHLDRRLERMETDPAYDIGYGRAVVKGFRKAMAWIRDADDERDLYAMKSLRFEKLKGDRAHQRSLRLNDQFRLIVQLEPSPSRPGATIVVVSIEDYH
jgi:toxin HigB-1